MRCLSQSLMLLVLPALLCAQTDGPGRGTWGAEGRTDLGGSLLRFRSESSAWVIGSNVFYFYRDGGSFSRDYTSVALRVGIRKYSRRGEKTRPYRTFGLNVEYVDGSGTGLRSGAGAEFGVAHFFTPHVSVGASGAASLTIWRDNEVSGGSSSRRTNASFTFPGVRAVVAVYF